ncbi:hypothetical protein [Frankia sp. Cppng1_Ct_nod]|uniref:hypothetical protein n=1 Tax=Frankia sp. Cppng1_Ct_nod TaxID=2897162 RepID=UPI0010413058|nr:hypothetical protein [Frankia sp. Cppng1_Ct_nod]
MAAPVEADGGHFILIDEQGTGRIGQPPCLLSEKVPMIRGATLDSRAEFYEIKDRGRTRTRFEGFASLAESGNIEEGRTVESVLVRCQPPALSSNLDGQRVRHRTTCTQGLTGKINTRIVRVCVRGCRRHQGHGRYDARGSRKDSYLSANPHSQSFLWETDHSRPLPVQLGGYPDAAITCI